MSQGCVHASSCVLLTWHFILYSSCRGFKCIYSRLTQTIRTNFLYHTATWAFSFHSSLLQTHVNTWSSKAYALCWRWWFNHQMFTESKKTSFPGGKHPYDATELHSEVSQSISLTVVEARWDENAMGVRTVTTGVITEDSIICTTCWITIRKYETFHTKSHWFSDVLSICSRMNQSVYILWYMLATKHYVAGPDADYYLCVWLAFQQQSPSLDLQTALHPPHGFYTLFLCAFPYALRTSQSSVAPSEPFRNPLEQRDFFSAELNKCHASSSRCLTSSNKKLLIYI